MQSVLLIYNPVAGTGRIKKELYEIVDFYNTNNYLVTLVSLRKLQENPEVIMNENYNIIVCSGGDGTINIIFSLLREKNIKRSIAYIPAGTTNDYASSLGIPNELMLAVNRTIEGKHKELDIGKFDEKFFLYVAGFGIFTNVAYTTSQKIKNLLGHAAYLLKGIQQLSEIKSYHMQVKTDEEAFEGDFILGLITNTTSIGGYKTLILNSAEMDDGKFEVLFVKRPNSISELHEMVLSLSSDKIKEGAGIIYCKTETVDIISDEEVAWTIDGEYGGTRSNVKIVNLRKEIEVIV